MLTNSFFFYPKEVPYHKSRVLGAGWENGSVAFSPHHLGSSNSEISVSLANSKLGRPGLFPPLEGRGERLPHLPNLVTMVTKFQPMGNCSHISSTNCLTSPFPGNLIHKSELGISGSRPSAREMGRGHRRVVV